MKQLQFKISKRPKRKTIFKLKISLIATGVHPGEGHVRLAIDQSASSRIAMKDTEGQ